MVLIYSPKISNRIKYIISLILKDLCGLEISFTKSTSEYSNYQGPRINYSQTPLSSEEVFIYAQGLLSMKGIKDFRPEVEYYNDLPVIFAGMSDHCSIGFDLFAASFYFVTRYEEYLPFKPDIHDRFEASQSIAYKNRFIEIPVVNLYAIIIEKQLMNKYNLQPNNNSRYDFCPTYDVDNAFAYLGKGVFRNFAGLLHDFFTFKIKSVTERIKVLLGKIKDPYDTFDYQISLQKKYGFAPTYFFLAANYAPYDKNIYVYSDKFESLVKKTGDYSYTGIHPSYDSYMSPEKMKMEINRFSKIANQPITKSRQHYIRLKFPETYRELISNNISEDYSMGYATHTGFRAGICTPFFFYDLEREQITNLKIIPFTVMDMTLIKYMSLAPSEATKKINRLIDVVKSVNGKFVSVWHNDSLSENGLWPGWKDVYTNLVKKASI